MEKSKPRFSREFVTNDMIRRIEEGAKKMGVSVDEYYKIRDARKNKVKTELDRVRNRGGNKSVYIKGTSNYNNIKGGLISLGTENNVNVKAYINKPDAKPHIHFDSDMVTTAERKSVYRTVYGYFSELQK